jgi:hypothetical protein
MGTPCDIRKIVVLGQENGKTVHEDNIISSLHTQGTNNNKYDETGKCGTSVKKHLGVPQTAFAKKHRFHTQPMNELNSGKKHSISPFTISLFSELFSAVTLQPPWNLGRRR